MTLPSLNLLSQSILSGMFIGGMYSLIGLGLGLSWGLLRQINLAHFGFVFLSAYITYHLSSVWGMDPLLALLILPPAFLPGRRGAAMAALSVPYLAIQLASGDFRLSR